MKFAYLIEPPFNDRDSDGTVKGCDVDLARYVAAKLGIRDVELIEAEFADLLPGLAAGRWRMTTGLFATEDRERIASFSRPIWALPDGLLVARGNPLGLSGYGSVAGHDECLLAVIQDQDQHRSAVQFGIPNDRIKIFETYTDAAMAVHAGRVSAYASVARAHAGFLEGREDLALELTTVPLSEKRPSYGSFAFARSDDGFRTAVDRILADYLGSSSHRKAMHRYGFSDAEIDLLVF
ncbi:MAG: transporter substrate-binding domain-containing protein [Pseudomonadota bacterium]